MKRANALCLVMFCAVVLAEGCSTAVGDAAVSDDGVTTTEAVQTNDASRSGETGSSLNDQKRQEGWFSTNLEDFDSLMASADGYVYYYTFEDLPAGLHLALAAVRPLMNECVLHFEGGEGKLVKLWMNYAKGEPELGDVQEVVLDGETYYYYEEYDEKSGMLMDNRLIWFKDGVRFLVDPDEPITEDVIRRYSKLRKVEFNVGQSFVGFGSGVPLIADVDRMKSVVRDNPGIQYHTGVFDPEKGNDLLEP